MPNQNHAQSDLSYPIQQETSPSLEDTLQQFMQSTYQILQAQSQSISKIETIVGQLATVIESEKQVYPNQPIPNPNSQIENEKENEVVEELVICIQPPNETKELDEIILEAHEENEKDIIISQEPINEQICIFTQNEKESNIDMQFSYFIDIPLKLRIYNFLVGVMLSIIIYGICIKVITHPTNEILHHRLGVG